MHAMGEFAETTGRVDALTRDERAIAEHLKIGIEACEELRREGAKLHSRKLRAFNEPPFR